MGSGRLRCLLERLGLGRSRGVDAGGSSLDRRAGVDAGGSSIFISYRHGDAALAASRIYEELVRGFGSNRVFMDIESIGIGANWSKQVQEALATFGIVVAVIGRDWNPPDAENRPRLADPDDFVRIELESALSRNILVIPVLVDGAQLPTFDELPPGLRPLANRTAIMLWPDHFDEGLKDLIEVMRRYDDAASGLAWGTIRQLPTENR